MASPPDGAQITTSPNKRCVVRHSKKEPATSATGHQEPLTLATAAAGPAPLADASEAWRRSPGGRVASATAVPQKPAVTPGGRHLCPAPIAEVPPLHSLN